MIQTAYYDSPLGRYVMAAEGGTLTGLWLEGQKYFPKSLPPITADEPEILHQAKLWLDDYFAGRRPEIKRLSLAPKGSDFAKGVWVLLCNIPYGQTMTYGQLAARIAQQQRIEHMSAQAVGGAVGHNPISIIIPCHRVLGADGGLTGYAGGLENKRFLLRHEGAIRKQD